jgi:Family of unknown function (DUF5677)
VAARTVAEGVRATPCGPTRSRLYRAAILGWVDNGRVSTRDDVHAHERACRRLIELAEAALPVVGPADHPDSRVYGAALIARVVGTIQAMLTLAPLGRDADLNILARSAFEHAVTFAWIAADPEHRFVRWQKEDATRRLEAHRDFRRFGEPLLEPVVEAELQRQTDVQYRGHPVKRPPNMPHRAEQADKYWGRRLQLPEPPHLASFRGVYTTIYRRGSSRTHASILGLNDVMTGAGGQYVVALESSVRPQPSLRMAPFVLGLAMYVASDAIGWPSRAAIDHVFEELSTGSG